MRRPFFRKQTQCWYVWVGKQQVNLGKDKKLAFAKYEAMGSATVADATYEPVVAVLNRFLEWTQRNRSPNTYRWYRDFLRSFAKSIGKRLRVAELSADHVESWVQSAYPDASDSTVRGAMGSVMRAMQWAVDRKLLTASPLRGLERPSAGRREFLISDELRERIFATTPDQEFRDMLTVLFETGCRPQEARLARGEYYDRPGQRWVFPIEESKGKKKRRVVYLPEAAIEVTDRLLIDRPEGRLLLNTDGAPWTGNALRCRFTRLAKKLQTPGLCAYAVRHTWATNRLLAGVDPVTVSVLMGHRDTTMVARVYQHLDAVPEHLHAALGK